MEKLTAFFKTTSGKITIYTIGAMVIFMVAASIKKAAVLKEIAAGFNTAEMQTKAAANNRTEEEQRRVDAIWILAQSNNRHSGAWYNLF